MEMLQSILGLVVLIAIAWAASETHAKPSVRLIVVGLAVQIGLALLLVKVPVVRDAVSAINALVVALDRASVAGTSFVFGFLGGGPLPFTENRPGASFVLAFRALPLVLVMSALSALLWHWRILPRVIQGLAWLLRRSLGIDGPVALGAAANVFAGMIEAALLIRPTLATMSRSDLFVVMTVGLTTLAGTMLVLYSTILASVIPNAAGHLVVASLISAPAAIVLARIMVPNTDALSAPTDANAELEGRYDSAMDALVKGTADGLKLLLSIIATLIVFVALVELINQILGLLPGGEDPLTLQRLLGWFLAPLAWLLGVPWAEAVTAGGLLGTKVVLNELLAYLQMAALPAEVLGERSRVILLYAMGSFANFGSLGIMLAGLLAMVPGRKDEIISLGLRSLLAGVLATAMTGAVIGLIV
ncbi:MAG: nucleoside:proton symporter [Rhodospirillaceae bacterium]|nr:nucleoside:proton symporter [Rhodospirillaceae bacterium]